MKKTSSPATATSLIIIGAITRLIPHPANFTPIGASSLLGGATLKRPWNYLVPIVTMVITDIFLGLHSTMIYVYGSFIVTAWLGEKLLKNNRSWRRVGLVSLLGSTIFFLVTNFGVWMGGYLYPKTAGGLLESYVMGLPFWRNMLGADLLFGLGFFALYAWAKKQIVIEKVDKRIAAWFGGN